MKLQRVGRDLVTEQQEQQLCARHWSKFWGFVCEGKKKKNKQENFCPNEVYILLGQSNEAVTGIQRWADNRKYCDWDSFFGLNNFHSL